MTLTVHRTTLTGMAICVWCDEPADSPTPFQGRPYHWVCLKLRLAVLRAQSQRTPEQARAARVAAQATIRRMRDVV